MAFNKRKKQAHLFRGNPHPTAEEKAAGLTAEKPAVSHSRPHPTAEELVVTKSTVKGKTVYRMAKPAAAPAKPKAKRVRK